MVRDGRSMQLMLRCVRVETGAFYPLRAVYIGTPDAKEENRPDIRFIDTNCTVYTVKMWFEHHIGDNTVNGKKYCHKQRYCKKGLCKKIPFLDQENKAVGQAGHN